MQVSAPDAPPGFPAAELHGGRAGVFVPVRVAPGKRLEASAWAVEAVGGGELRLEYAAAPAGDAESVSLACTARGPGAAAALKRQLLHLALRPGALVRFRRLGRELSAEVVAGEGRVTRATAVQLCPPAPAHDPAERFVGPDARVEELRGLIVAATRPGARLTRPLVLQGPPGSGKTATAREAVRRAGVRVSWTSGPALLAGRGWAALLAELPPGSLLAVDDADAVQGLVERRLLRELELQASSAVLLVGARERPGGVAVRLAAPSHAAREALVEHMLGRPCAELADATPGALPSDLRRLCQRAARPGVGVGAAVAAFRPAALRGQSAEVSVPRAGWDGVWGYAEQVARLRVVQEQWRGAASPLGAAVRVSGVLLHGPSGCGKGRLAEALAGGCGASLVRVKASDLLSAFFGETERAVRELFARAAAAAPCALLFEDLDVLAARREGDASLHTRVLASLLTEMDGVAARAPGVLFLGATSRREAVDEALLRPGRIDCHVAVPLPDEATREAILAALGAPRELAGPTAMWTGARMVAAAREARLAGAAAVVLWASAAAAAAPSVHVVVGEPTPSLEPPQALVVVPGMDGAVRAFSAASGSPLWTFDTGAPALSGAWPGADAGLVEVAEGRARAPDATAVVPAVDGSLFSVDAIGHLSQLSHSVEEIVDASVTLLESSSLLVGHKTSSVFALDARTGARVSGAGLNPDECAAAADALYLARHDHQAVEYAPSGEMAWNVSVARYSLVRRVREPEACAANATAAVLLPRLHYDALGYLSGRDSRSGHLLWTTRMPSPPVALFGVALESGEVEEQSLAGASGASGSALATRDGTVWVEALPAAPPGPAEEPAPAKPPRRHSQITQGGLFVSWRVVGFLVAGVTALVGVIALACFRRGRAGPDVESSSAVGEEVEDDDDDEPAAETEPEEDDHDDQEIVTALTALRSPGHIQKAASTGALNDFLPLPPPAIPVAPDEYRSLDESTWSSLSGGGADSPPQTPESTGSERDAMSPPASLCELSPALAPAALRGEFPAASPRTLALSSRRSPPPSEMANGGGIGDTVPVCTDRYASDFVEEARLGDGGFGSVWLATNRIDGHRYAVKRVRFNSAAEFHLVHREVAALAALDHVNVVRYHQAWLEAVAEADWCSSSDEDSGCDSCDSDVSDFAHSRRGRHRRQSSLPIEVSDDGFEWAAPVVVSGDDEPVEDPVDPSSRGCARRHRPVRDVQLFIQMQWCSSRTLRDFLQRSARTTARAGGAVDVGHVLRIVAQASAGLQHVHGKGLIHRDLKPENIFFGDEGVIKIGDFGLSKEEGGPPDADPPLQRQGSSSHSSNHTTGIGTSMYASPEQLACREYAESSDLFALGLILFEMLHPAFSTQMERAQVMQAARSGELPGADAWPLRESHPALVELVSRLLAHDPSARPSAGEVVELCELLQGSRDAAAAAGAAADVLLRVVAAPEAAHKKDDMLIAVASVVREAMPATQLAQLTARTLAGRTVLELTLSASVEGLREAMEGVGGVAGVADVLVAV